ncbi:MAG: MbnP family protein [Verrucomicrobiota bacterium]
MKPIITILLLSFAATLHAANLQLEISHIHSAAPLFLESQRYKTKASESYALTRLSYLLSGFALQTASGEWIELPNEVAYFDARKRLQSHLLSNVDPSQYTALRFNLGVDKRRNHSDPAQYPPDHPLNPNHNQLHWTWQDGYIFLALEGRYVKEKQQTGFVFHLANDWNLTPITLPAQIDLRHNAAIEISFDLNKLFTFPQPITFADDGDSTHSDRDDALAAKLASNIPYAFQADRALSFAPKRKTKPLSPIDFPQSHTPYAFNLNKTFPIPDLPPDNPLIQERVDLGEKLFFDPRLSFDNTISCASCHDPKLSFSDPRKLSVGIQNKTTSRHSMPLVNLAWKDEFFWDGRVSSLREQVIHPLTDPTEMGSDLDALLKEIADDPNYKSAFPKAFASGEISALNLSLALESFILTIVADDSRFDQAMRGEARLTEQERRGFELFMTEYEPRSKRFGADCFHCHGGALFTDNQFHDNGLQILDADLGRAHATGEKSDERKFSTPTLRNLTLTAPYMHDGRFATLEEVVAHYAGPIEKRDTLDPNLAKHPASGLQLSPSDQAALVAFLKTLTDPEDGL